MECNETTQNISRKGNQQTPFLHTALQLARMYGVAETLHPIPPLSMEEFFPLIKSWAGECEALPDMDVLTFFEEKMKQIEQNKTSG